MPTLEKAPLPWTSNDLLYSIGVGGGVIEKAPLPWTTNDLLYSLLLAQGAGGANGGGGSGLPSGGDPGEVLTIDAGGNPVWVTPAGGGAAAANPTALVGLTAVNGVATTLMRSDAAPALSQAIAPTWTARHIFSVAGAADTPALRLTGAPFTGGTATTTKPLLLIEPAGAVSTGWSTSGTGLGINAASTFVGSLIDAQVNGVSLMQVSAPVGGVELKLGRGSQPWDYGKIVKAGGPTSYMLTIYGRGDNVSGGVGFGQNTLTESGLYLDNPGILGWGNGSPNGYATDLVLGRLGAASLRLGKAPSATPIAQIFTIGEASRSGTDSNVAGAHGTIQCGLGTGNALPSELRFQTPTIGSSGNAAQVYATRMVVSSGGCSVTGGISSSQSIVVGDGFYLVWATKSRMASPADGIIQLGNAALSDFSRLQFGGATNAFPSIKRSGAGLAIRLADDSADSSLTVADEAYGPAWDGSLAVPTKNALYDKIQTLGGGGGVAVGDSPTWTGIHTFSAGAAGPFATFVDASQPTFSKPNFRRINAAAEPFTGATVGVGLAFDYTGGSKAGIYISNSGIFTIEAVVASPYIRLNSTNVAIDDAGSASPPSRFLQIGCYSRAGTDVNIGGGNGTIRSGMGTGTGAASSLIFQTPDTVGAGSAVQTYATRLTISASGVVATGNFQTPLSVFGSAFGSPGYGFLSFPADGVALYRDNALTNFGRICLGGTTASFPALKRTTTGFAVRTADDSADSFLTVADEVYGASWNGSLQVPTKNAVYDKIQTMSGGGVALGDSPTWTGRHIHSINAAASAPVISLTGSPFAGTATTSKAVLLLEPTGTTSTGWTTTGTMLGVNAATAFAGALIDAQIAGVSKFKVDSTGPKVDFGTTSAPGYSFIGGTNYGMFVSGSGRTGLVSNGTCGMAVSAQAVTLANNFPIGWTGGDAAIGTVYTWLASAAAATLQMGLNASAPPVAQIFKGPDRITTDGAGGDLTIMGGANRGAFPGGVVYIKNCISTTGGSAGPSVIAFGCRVGVPFAAAFTVALLPAAASAGGGAFCWVTDATQAAGTGAGTAPTGGGAVGRMVYCNGTAWLLI